MRVRVVKENEDLPIGSTFEVESSSKKNHTYTGYHSSYAGTYEVTVKKKYCEEVDPNETPLQFWQRMKDLGIKLD